MTIVFSKDKGRFKLVGPFDEEKPNLYLMITDIGFWLDHETKIYEWMETNLPKGRLHQTGMVLEFTDETDVINFLLKWS